MSEFNNTKRKYITALHAISEKYGEQSNATLMIEIEYLAFLLQEEGNLIDDIAELQKSIAAHYVLDKPGKSSSYEVISVSKDSNGDILYHYSQEAFNNDIKTFGRRNIDIRKIRNEQDFLSLPEHRWYLFVVSPEDELIVAGDPMDTYSLVTNRKVNDTNDEPLFHTLLAEKDNLTVKAAGELFPIVKDHHLKALIFNTKSGHFCPEPESSKVVQRVLKSFLPTQRVVGIPVRLRIPATEGRKI